MQDEATWMSGQSADESAAKERYEYFTRPEPRENMSDIFEIDDPYLGPKTKVREVKIGMTRNAAEENKKVVTAYLEPFPHIRIDKAKDLQGWYQSKTNESKASRPRPCFTEAILTEPYGGYCAVGCQFCVSGETLVHTPEGDVPISSLRPADKVLAKEQYGVVTSTVLKTSSREVFSLLEITLSSGKIIKCTPEHPFFIDGKRVQSINLRAGDSIERIPDDRSALRNLWEEYVFSGKEDLLPRMSYEEAKRAPTQLLRPSSKRTSPYGSYKKEDERSYAPASGKSGQGVSQVRRMEEEDDRKAPGGEVGVLHLQENSLQAAERKDDSLSLYLGISGSSVPNQTRSGLGVRTKGSSVKVRSLPSRLLGKGMGSVYRSERILSGRSTGEVSPVQEGFQNISLGQKEAPQSGDTIVNIREVHGVVTVYDIQTTSENFYMEGVLSSNCYINSGMRGYRGTGLISVPLNYGEQIKGQLQKMRRSAAGYFSSFTDPFTPLENHYHNTQEAAEAFVEVGLPIFFLSRLAYPDWAIDLLTANPHSYAQKSINTSNAEDWRRLSPGAISLEEHLQEIALLHDKGIYVSIQVNPIVPGITSNGQIVKLFKMLRDAGADHVIVKFVEAAYSWAPAMVERMKKVFGKERGEAFEKLFTQNIGSEKTIEESYRLNAHAVFSEHAKRLGLTYATCYEYEYQRDSDGNIINKTGVSIGRRLTTASQCHGHTVPMYQRDSDEEDFKSIEECPPSGCLYCADENEGKPRCGDELAGSAPALKLSDLKVKMGEGKRRAYELPVIP